MSVRKHIVTRSSGVSHLGVDNRRDPLTRLASADENASSSHPLPQGGEGNKINSPLAPLGERGPGVRGSVVPHIVKYYAGHHTSEGVGSDGKLIRNEHKAPTSSWAQLRDRETIPSPPANGRMALLGRSGPYVCSPRGRQRLGLR